MQLSEQIDCVRMELDRREQMLPVMVKEGRMSPERSSREIDRMKAVLDTLSQLQEGKYIPR